MSSSSQIPETEPETKSPNQPTQIDPNPNPNPSNSETQSQEEWAKMSQSWLSTFPEGKTPTMDEFEAWFESNRDSVPQDVKLMSKTEVYNIVMSIQTSLIVPTQVKEPDSPILAYRFQRSDLWRPVYTWLESLDTDEIVGANEIANWLAENPSFVEQLTSKHSRYHLKHYIKKCHMKILKRRERKKNLKNPTRETPVKVQKTVVTKQATPFPYDPLRNVPKDSELYIAKQKEALQKFEILVALENELLKHFPKPASV